MITARLTSNGGSYSPRNARYDWLTLNHFADMTGGGLGVTLSSWDNSFMNLGSSTPYVLDTATPRISVLVGGRAANGASGEIRDQAGDSYFLQRFALQTHDAYSQTGAMKFSLEHQNPFATGVLTGGSEYPEGSFSLLTVSNGNVVVWAVKAAEEGIASGLIVRVWILDDTAAAFALDFPGRTIARIVKTTHVETDIEDLAPAGGALQDTLTPQQIKTYRVFLNP
jgi:alpha-mannosidase